MTTKSSPSISRRFRSKDQKINALLCQQIVNGNKIVAKKIVNHSKICNFKSNIDILTQGDEDNDIYLILSGSVSIIVNGRIVAIRKAGEHIGEMALLDTTARRSATIKTCEDTVAIKISEKDFTNIANRHPDIWRKLAIVIAQRLRERSKYHTVPRSQPTVFIGSSTEGLPLAQSINNYLSRCQCVPRLWSNDIFECSQVTINDLLRATKESDFAVLVLTPDDIVETRNKRKASPRDNVIFEIGLFMGALSLERTYVIVPNKLDIKIPTDLLGITFLTYKKNKYISIARCMTPISKKLKQLINKLGPI